MSSKFLGQLLVTTISVIIGMSVGVGVLVLHSVAVQTAPCSALATLTLGQNKGSCGHRNILHYVTWNCMIFVTIPSLMQTIIKFDIAFIHNF